MSKTDYEEYVDVQVDALIKKLEMFKIYERKFKSLDGILKDLEVCKKEFSDPKSPSFEQRLDSKKNKDITNDVLVKFISKEKTLEDDKNLILGKMREVETIIELIPNDDIRLYMKRHYVKELSDETPQEILERVQKELDTVLKDEILERIHRNPPDFFEHLVVGLMEKMGYGRGKRWDGW